MTDDEPLTTPECPDAEKVASESSAMEIAGAGAVVGSGAGRHLIERLGMQAERVVDHARGEHVERGRRGHDNGLRGRIDFTHDRRRVVGAGDGDDKVPGRDAAIVVVDRHGVFQRQNLALRQIVERGRRRREMTGRPSRTWSRRPWSRARPYQRDQRGLVEREARGGAGRHRMRDRLRCGRHPTDRDR